MKKKVFTLLSALVTVFMARAQGEMVDITPEAFDFSKKEVGLLVPDGVYHGGNIQVLPADGNTAIPFSTLFETHGRRALFLVSGGQYSNPETDHAKNLLAGMAIVNLGGEVGKVLAISGHNSNVNVKMQELFPSWEDEIPLALGEFGWCNFNWTTDPDNTPLFSENPDEYNIRCRIVLNVFANEFSESEGIAGPIYCSSATRNVKPAGANNANAQIMSGEFIERYEDGTPMKDDYGNFIWNPDTWMVYEFDTNVTTEEDIPTRIKWEMQTGPMANATIFIKEVKFFKNPNPVNKEGAAARKSFITLKTEPFPTMRLTATVENVSRLYGDENPSFTSTYSGFTNGDDASVVTNHGIYTTVATKKSDVGTYSIKQSGATAQNYSFKYVDGKLTVNKAPLTMAVNNKNITYGSNFPDFDVTYTGLKNDEIRPKWNIEPTITTTATSKSNVGVYPISINDADATNYTMTVVSGTLTISKAPLSINADSKSKLYCEENPELTYSCVGFVKNETDEVLIAKPQLVTTAKKNSETGVYPIEISGAEAENYNISYQYAELNIKKRELTVSSQNYTRFYGEENPEFEVQYSGFVNNEDESVLIMRPKATTTATATSDVGEYSITVSNGVAANYDFTYKRGKLTIEKAYQTMDWEQDLNDIRQYDQVELNATASSGLDVTYTIEGNPICSIVKIGQKQYLDCFGTGDAVISAVQKGNKNYWPTTKKYKQITISNTTGICETMSDVTQPKIYDAAGNRINELQKGFNIIKMSDGTTKKIFVK